MIVPSNNRYTTSEPSTVHRPTTKHSTSANTTYAKYLERQVIRAWKKLTRTNHKYPRASFVPQGFVFVTARGTRRSVLIA